MLYSCLSSLELSRCRSNRRRRRHSIRHPTLSACRIHSTAARRLHLSGRRRRRRCRAASTGLLLWRRRRGWRLPLPPAAGTSPGAGRRHQPAARRRRRRRRRRGVRTLTARRTRHVPQHLTRWRWWRSPGSDVGGDGERGSGGSSCPSATAARAPCGTSTGDAALMEAEGHLHTRP